LSEDFSIMIYILHGDLSIVISYKANLALKEMSWNRRIFY